MVTLLITGIVGVVLGVLLGYWMAYRWMREYREVQKQFNTTLNDTLTACMETQVEMDDFSRSFVLSNGHLKSWLQKIGERKRLEDAHAKPN
jgi:ABC-type lipoprotein release transport system permease subunit